MAEDFLLFLVDETLKLQKNGEVKLSSLELKLKDYGLNFLRGESISISHVVRFRTHFGVIDIPMNWSVFSGEDVECDKVILSEKADRDHFFKVIKSAWNENFERLLIMSADGFYYLVGLKSGEENYLHDLLRAQEWFSVA